MADGDKDDPPQKLVPLAKRLVAETGISEAQAREPIATLGVDWASLVREAQLLRKIGRSWAGSSGAEFSPRA
ncbi:hypothetical protein [Arvimicrobium flavum]|uniref:hypothetical protein n=1 Tax=Arvimicrobium flavum TaxID=3393320 RepID=UPI00237AF49D|nr:hypothetical protein [Mesorhizobium shangrilense]